VGHDEGNEREQSTDGLLQKGQNLGIMKADTIVVGKAAFASSTITS
jgi:hypothetical protein